MSVAATLRMSSPRGMSVLKHSSSGAWPGCLLANEGPCWSGHLAEWCFQRRHARRVTAKLFSSFFPSFRFSCSVSSFCLFCSVSRSNFKVPLHSRSVLFIAPSLGRLGVTVQCDVCLTLEGCSHVRLLKGESFSVYSVQDERGFGTSRLVFGASHSPVCNLHKYVVETENLQPTYTYK